MANRRIAFPVAFTLRIAAMGGIAHSAAWVRKGLSEGEFVAEFAGFLPPEIQGLLAVAEAQQSQGQSGQALDTLQQAKDKAQAAGNPAVTAQVTAALASMRAAAGLGGEALAAMREASDLYGQAGDRRSQIRAQIQLAGLQAATGQFDASKTLLRACLDAAGQLGDGQLLSEAHLAAGQVLLATRYAAAAADESAPAWRSQPAFPRPPPRSSSGRTWPWRCSSAGMSQRPCRC